mgnify:CR=1 FL=1
MHSAIMALTSTSMEVWNVNEVQKSRGHTLLCRGNWHAYFVKNTFHRIMKKNSREEFERTLDEFPASFGINSGPLHYTFGIDIQVSTEAHCVDIR